MPQLRWLLESVTVTVNTRDVRSHTLVLEFAEQTHAAARETASRLHALRAVAAAARSGQPGRATRRHSQRRYAAAVAATPSFGTPRCCVVFASATVQTGRGLRSAARGVVDRPGLARRDAARVGDLPLTAAAGLGHAPAGRRGALGPGAGLCRAEASHAKGGAWVPLSEVALPTACTWCASV